MRRDDIRILAIRSPKPGMVPFRISFEYPDQRKAQQAVQALAVRFVSMSAFLKNLDESNFPRKAAFPLNLDVLDPPSFPPKPSKPNRILILTTGLSAGVLLAAVTKLVMRLRSARAG
jgi:uncharacterized protein involved in exopolysaccharide biosynthesis